MSEQKYEELTLQQAVEAVQRGEDVFRTRTDGEDGWLLINARHPLFQIREIAAMKFRRAVPKQARPYKTIDEVPMGKEYKSKDGCTRGIVANARINSNGLWVDGCHAIYFLRDYIFADGTPCGVVE